MAETLPTRLPARRTLPRTITWGHHPEGPGPAGTFALLRTPRVTGTRVPGVPEHSGPSVKEGERQTPSQYSRNGSIAPPFRPVACHSRQDVCSPLMSTWVTLRGPDSPPEWHLEAARPGDKPGVVYTACGQTWDASVEVPIERRGGDASIQRALRCPDCQAIYLEQPDQGWRPWSPRDDQRGPAE